MKKSFIILLALVGTLLACSNEMHYHEVKSADYVLEIPDYLSKTDNLNDEASMQYQNPIRELYIIAIDESKSDFEHTLKENALYSDSLGLLEHYRNILLNSYSSVIEGYHKLSEKKERINNLDAYVVSFTGETNGHQVYYKVAFIESGDKLYQVMVWTLDSYRKRYEGQMDHMLHSFHLKNAVI